MRNNLVIFFTLALSALTACGDGAAPPALDHQTDLSDLVGDWELVMPEEAWIPEGDGAPTCTIRLAGLLTLGVEGESMLGLLEESTCGGAAKRQAWTQRILTEPGEAGDLLMMEAPAGHARQWRCILLEEDTLRCDMPSPFRDQMMVQEWVRAD